ncbi:MAG: glycoside hydrolase family 13 protein [Bacilli bacterium]
MNQYALFHKSESSYCFPLKKDEITIRLRTSREDDISSIYVVYGCKYDFYAVQHQEKMMLRYQDSLFSYYEVSIKLSDVRLTYVFKIISQNKTYYYSEDGLSETYDFAYNFYNCFQYAYIHENDVLHEVEFMKNAIFYEVFIDRFKIGNKEKNTSYINMKWNEKPTPTSFAGGDLQGIIDSLDYLSSLGINALYLTPIFKSKSNHKYDIEDYFQIDEQFGDEATLKELVTKAHEKNIKIVLDAVFNHISEDNYLFKDVKKNKEKSKYFDYFIFKGDDYECFSICKYMPKLNTDNPHVRQYLIGVGKYYIEKFDIDGWRLDVSDEVSHSFWKEFRREMKKTKKDVVLIGENWHEASKYLQGDEFDSIMNYSFTKALLDYLAFDKFTSKMMADKLNELQIRNITPVNKMMLNLIDTHDTLRFYTEINKNLDKYLIALTLLYFYQGVPCLYYGDESLMEGGYDPDSRRGFIKNCDNDAFHLIQELSKLRKEPSFTSGELYIKSEGDILILERQSQKDCYRLIINISSPCTYKAQNVILSNNYKLNILGKYSFVMERRDDNER